MIEKLSGWDDTIVALATPPGVSALGVIRLSGSKAIEIANQLFPSKDLSSQTAPSIHIGFLQEDQQILDEVVISLYKGPRSYTGEDLVEISAHGSPYILQQIVNACIRKDARLARAGEFTQRAFLHGKMDLAQAEAVADLIASNTTLSQKAALHNMRGGFSQQLKALRERLIRFSALIELELDFSQEDVEFADRKQLLELVDEVGTVTRALIESFKLGNVIRQGVSAAIIGKPNTGKSTLLNEFLNEDRAIVSEIAGTTRDTIEEVINIDGILFRLVDTAGIRQHTQDSIESIGIRKSLEKMKQADIVIYLIDAESGAVEELAELNNSLSAQAIKHLLVINKIDVVGEEQARKKFSQLPGPIFLSAINGKNIDELKRAMVDMILEGKAGTESTIVTNARHVQALEKLQAAIVDIKKGLDEKLPGDLLALDIRQSLQYLGEITGEITNEDQLDYIFSKFCIGK